VFFYKEGDKKSHKIITELENIDDECEEEKKHTVHKNF